MAYPLFRLFRIISPVEKRAQELGQKVSEGTATEEEKDEYHIWSPFLIPISDFSFEKLILLLVLAKYLKTPEGMKELAGLAKQYLQIIGQTMTALAAAGGINPLATVVHGEITVQVYRTLGLLSAEQSSNLATELAWALNKMILKDALSGISSVTSAVFGTALPALGVGGVAPPP